MGTELKIIGVKGNKKSPANKFWYFSYLDNNLVNYIGFEPNLTDKELEDGYKS